MNIFGWILDAIANFFRWLLYLPLEFFSVPRRLLGLSLPMRAAIASALLLTTVSAVVVFVIWPKAQQVGDPWHYFWPAVAVGVLLLIIPAVIHYSVKLWIEGDIPLFPDIDEAWRAGMTEMAKQGIDIRNTPLFLVIGPADGASIRQLMGLSNIPFAVAGVPSNQPLAWYANPDAIFLVCPGTSQVAALLNRAKSGAKFGPLPSSSKGGGTALAGTIVVGSDSDDIRATAAPSSLRSTDVPSSRVTDTDAGLGGGGGSDWLRGTMMVGGSSEESRGSGSRPARVADTFLPTEEARELQTRLDHVCQLIVRARQPVCPINGILTVLPFDLIEQGAGIQVQLALHNDLRSLNRGLLMRCPVVCMVGRLETEVGFIKLVQRVGLKKAQEQRFGRGFNVQSVPDPEQLDAFAAHACGAFEDWIYELFRQPEGLSDPGNSKLYRLLSKVRRLRDSMKHIFTTAFAYDPNRVDNEPGAFFRFGGCYFAATGETEDQQAFVKSVFEKLLDSQGELEWMPSALRTDDKYHFMAKSVLVLNGVLLMGIAAVVVKKFFFTE